MQVGRAVNSVQLISMLRGLPVNVALTVLQMSSVSWVMVAKLRKASWAHLEQSNGMHVLLCPGLSSFVRAELLHSYHPQSNSRKLSLVSVAILYRGIGVEEFG